MDRFFSPPPKRYGFTDLQISVSEKIIENIIDEDTPDIEEDEFEVTFNNLLANASIAEQTQQLSEITIRARRNRGGDIFHNRSTSVAYYDGSSELDDLYDRGGNFDNIHEMIMNMNENFYTEIVGRNELLMYKNKFTVVIVDYKPIRFERTSFFSYLLYHTSSIKSIYINENFDVISQYIIPPSDSDINFYSSFGCVVFIETFPDEEMSVAGSKGVRKTWLEGYSAVKEFYMPDYSELPPMPDYRRTLYWNPSVTPDENGNAKIQFYNNSTCKSFNISAETVTFHGMIGINKDN